MTYLPIVFLAHPVGAPTPDGIEANLRQARRWLAWLIRNTPFAYQCSWLGWTNTGVLEENADGDRERGLEMNAELLRGCDAIALCGGRISPGMERELARAQQLGLAIVDLTPLGASPPDLTVHESLLQLYALGQRRPSPLGSHGT